MSLADTFAQVAADALLLDLRQLRATIRATCDDGLRAASYDGPGGRSADTSSTVERQALSDRRDPSWDDLARIDHHEARFITAIAELAQRSHSRGVPETWDEAVQDAHLLAEMDAVGVLERISGSGVAKWVHAAAKEIQALADIAGRHPVSGRAATKDERNWTDGFGPNDICAWHADLAPKGRYRRLRLPGKNICPACAVLAEMGGQRPPGWVLEAEVERDAKPKAWAAVLSRYADELGIVRERSA